MSVDSGQVCHASWCRDHFDCLTFNSTTDWLYSDQSMLALGWAAELSGAKQTASEPHGAGLSVDTEAHKGTVVCSSFV